MDSAPFALSAPTMPLIPHPTPIRDTPERRRERAAQEAERERRVVEATAVASAEWRETRTSLALNRVALAVLDLHEPQAAYDGAACAECLVVEGYDTASTPWPCDTYSAVRRDRYR